MGWGKEKQNGLKNKISDIRYREEVDLVDKKTPPINYQGLF